MSDPDITAMLDQPAKQPTMLPEAPQKNPYSRDFIKIAIHKELGLGVTHDNNSIASIGRI